MTSRMKLQNVVIKYPLVTIIIWFWRFSNFSFLILRDPRQCPSKHLFCSSCIFTWSLSSNEGRNKCPVCRTAGRYKPNFKLESLLSKKHVKCIEKACEWTGTLRGYRSHYKIHKKKESDENGLVLPPLVPMRSNTPWYLSRDYHVPPPVLEAALDSDNIIESLPRREHQSYDQMQRQISRRRQRVENMMEMFSDQLDRRRQNIESFYTERERVRRESMNEVRDLGRRLHHVSSNLYSLMDNMSRDSERYQSYIRDQPDFGIFAMSRNSDVLPMRSGEVTEIHHGTPQTSRAVRNNISRGISTDHVVLSVLPRR